MFDPPLDICKFEVAAGLAVARVWAAVCVVECGPPKTAQVVCKQRNAMLGPANVDVVVAADVVPESVHVERDGFRRLCWPGPSVELVPVKSRQPRLSVGGSRHF